MRHGPSLLLSLALSTPALASDWQFTVLPAPPNAQTTYAFNIGANQTCGYTSFGQPGHATLWTLPANTITDLHPAGATDSRIYATDGHTQAGAAVFNTISHAGLWTNTAGSWQDLHSNNFPATEACENGAQIVGWALYNGGQSAHALLWPTASKDIVIDLNPANSSDSRACLTDGAVQYGYAIVSGKMHAARWTGSAQSYTSLTPDGYSAADIHGGSPDEQAGLTEKAGVRRAALWHGTKESFVDLHPPQGVAWSQANASDGLHQVGHSEVAGDLTASFWSGSPDTFVDLGALLPPDYGYSTAAGAVTRLDGIYIAGYALNNKLGHEEAILWHLPACPADCNTDGALDVFDFLCFQNNFVAATPTGDCDASGTHDLFDFFCFVNAFNAGCP